MPDLSQLYLNSQQPAPTETLQPKEEPAHHSSLGDMFLGIKAPKQGKPVHDPNPLQRVEAFGQWAAASPVAQGANAVLNATSNAGVGAVDSALGGKNAAKGALDSVTNPGQAFDRAHDIEKRVGLPVADEKAPWYQKLGQAVEDFGVQTVLDPATYIPGLDVISVGGRIVKAAKMIPGLDKAAQAIASNKLVDKTAGFINPDHDLRKIVTREGQNSVNAAKARGATPGQISQDLEAQHRRYQAGFSTRKVLNDNQTIAALDQHLKGTGGYSRMLAQTMASSANPLRAVSDAQRDALFALPFGHVKNLTILAMLGSKNAPRVISAGMKYSRQLAKDPSSLAAEMADLEHMGGTIHYTAPAGGSSMYSQSWLQTNPIAQKLGLGKLSGWSNSVLENYDNGLRLALKDELERRGIIGDDAGGEIRDIMGGGDSSRLVQTLQGIGANFPAWRLGVVPKALGKAARDQPGAVKAYARANADIDNDVTEPTFKSALDVGGPAEDAAKLVEPVAGTASFLTSPSTVGPVSTLFDIKDKAKSGQLGQLAAEQIENLIPLGGLLKNSGLPVLDPYKESAPTAARQAAGLAGAYFTPKLPERSSGTAPSRWKQLKALGMDDHTAYAQLKAEGYIRPQLGNGGYYSQAKNVFDSLSGRLNQ